MGNVHNPGSIEVCEEDKVKSPLIDLSKKSELVVQKLEQDSGKQNGGMIYVMWGYNRGYHSAADTTFHTPNGTFTIHDAVGYDRPTKFGIAYLDPTQMSKPQYNIRIGYQFNEKWAVEIGQDHMKWVFDPSRQYKITGDYDKPLWGHVPFEQVKESGNAGFVLFEHTDGYNYVHAGPVFTKNLFIHEHERHGSARRRLAAQAPPRQAALDALKLILCSPSFLYLSEITDEPAKALSPLDLASRLSYALWAAPPDAPLLAAAKTGTLSQTEELRSHAVRMLSDGRSDGFVNGFLDGWLNLRDLGGMPPPRETNRAYYAEDLPSSMKAEVRTFFRDLLARDGSAALLLDADYTFVDKKLAKLYDLPEKASLKLADGFQRVSLAGNPRRGGLLGMAGVLAVSANGVETSPVTRGVWVSENILGVPPPKPPDVVPAIEPDVSGATTIRERLAKHRADATCAECHRKIDPLGFSLESFDPIGRWRNNYPKPKNGKAPSPAVDTSGEFSSGQTYKDFAGFKKILRETREDLFTRNLIRQFLSYAAGRHMEPADDLLVEELHGKIKAQGMGVQTLVLECLLSDIFRNR
jgi:hypothetical protein